ncbi:C-X-C motif chemokine 11 [Echeneis naucrates]|uniref:Chemokine interleukin-8-like domain-containing protein n=1 Tax=Echeneis naucrates TaxID=173247 RepID=A0A665UJG9_ECHNA|nr:C-X-C motif chemokine 9 [Echeneis naucrates]
MKCSLPSICQLAFLSLCCALIAVRESDSTFVPGRCRCPISQDGIKGQLKGLTVYQKSPTCNKITVIVTLKSKNEQVCLNPEALMGKQLIRCWNRVHSMGHDVTLCLRRRRNRRKGGQRRRPQQQ